MNFYNIEITWDLVLSVYIGSIVLIALVMGLFNVDTSQYDFVSLSLVVLLWFLFITLIVSKAIGIFIRSFVIGMYKTFKK